MHADLDTLLTASYVLIDDLLPERPRGPGRPPEITDAELMTLLIAQALLQIPDDRRFIATARRRLGHLFPYLPEQPGYSKRVRALVPKIGRAIGHLAFLSPSFCDGLRLLDSTPVPCAASRETVRRSELAGDAAYGYCASHSRWFWGFRLYLLCAADGTPIAFELAAADEPERKVAKEMLEGVGLEGFTVIADKGFSGRDFEAFMADRGAAFLRPDRKDEERRFGSLAAVRQWVESAFWSLKGQLGLERHGARTLPGLCARIGARLLALSAALLHNWQIGEPGRHLSAYAH
jgi:hypothetical protein